MHDTQSDNTQLPPPENETDETTIIHAKDRDETAQQMTTPDLIKDDDTQIAGTEPALLTPVSMDDTTETVVKKPTLNLLDDDETGHGLKTPIPALLDDQPIKKKGTPLPLRPEISPANLAYRRREKLPTPVKWLIAVLAILLIVSGLSFIVYGTTVQYKSSLRYSTTAQVQLTKNTQKTAQANDQSINTAQANIEATATAQVDKGVQATASVDNATATASAHSDFYTNATNGIPVLDDPLGDNSGSGKWDEGSPSANTGCTFTNSSYHVSEAQQNYFQPCIAQGTRYGSFAYQVHLTINKGGNTGQAGLLFRIDSSNKSYYFFHIAADGSYALDLYQSNNQNTLTKGINVTAIHTGLGGANELTVVANSNTLFLFANGEYLAAVNDATLSVGKIGLGVVNISTPIDVQFSDAQVWQLQSTSNPQATPTDTIPGGGLTPTPSSRSGTPTPTPTQAN